MPFERVGDLELAQDLRFQRRDWIAQRVGWVLMALFLLAALAGLIGRGGPLARTQAQSADGGLRVEYDRFAHYEAPTRLRLIVSDRVARGKDVRLWIERAYLANARLQQVMPEPQSVRLAGERVIYVFDAGAGGEVSFELKPDTFGVLAGRAGLEGGGEVAFRHFVYP
jgi:hypothetical protein